MLLSWELFKSIAGFKPADLLHICMQPIFKLKTVYSPITILMTMIALKPDKLDKPLIPVGFVDLFQQKTESSKYHKNHLLVDTSAVPSQTQ